MRGAGIIAAVTLPFLVAAVPLVAWLQFEQAPDVVRVQLTVSSPDIPAGSLTRLEGQNAAWATAAGFDESLSTDGCHGASSS